MSTLYQVAASIWLTISLLGWTERFWPDGLTEQDEAWLDGQ